MTNKPTPPTIDNLREQIAEHKYNTMSEARKQEIVGEVIWADVREEGVPIKCHGEPMDGRAPFLVAEEDDWLTVMHDSGKYKSGTPTSHRLNIWLDDQTNKWQWALYDLPWWDNKRSLGTAIAHGDAEPIVDYEGH